MPEPPHVVGRPSQGGPGCNACQAIRERFTNPESTQAVKFGSFEEALATDCPNHKPLVQAFIDFIRKFDERVPMPETDDMGIAQGHKGHSVTMTKSISKLGIVWSLLLANKSSVPNHPGTGRFLDPDWVDLNTVKTWKQTCLSSHGAKCENPLKIPHTRPAWVIDVERKCLVSGQVPGQFVALSYANEKHAKRNVDADTLARLQKPHALDTPETIEYLNPIIRRAMHLTSTIGERYLWAAGLCFATNDQEVAAEQPRLLGATYASAVMTIIAADGDSESGLSGLKGASNPRELDQRVIPFGDEHILVRNTPMFAALTGAPYFRRGWTYQPYIMSGRRIMFNNRELHWECQCSVWHEEMVINAEIDRHIDYRLKTLLAGFPDLGCFGYLVTDYNRNMLDDDEDVLPAISSLLWVVSRSFEGGFLFGIPEMFFERALCWSPFLGHVSLRRRVASTSSGESQPTPSGLPSWSWMGWHGLVDLGYGEAARINTRLFSIEETTPITEWYTSHSPSDPPSERRRIRSTWYENRDIYKDLTKPLPPGWTRHDISEMPKFRGEPHISPPGFDKYIFAHPALPDPDEGTKAWYYPFPVTEIQESTPGFMPEQTRYLFCKTSKGRLQGHQSGKWNTVTLCNDSGNDVGSLNLHNSESLTPFPKSVGAGVTGLPVDLVAVCKSKTYSKSFSEEKKTYSLPLKREDTYFVLWVEWKDGVAYRLASGQVNAAEWEKLDLEHVDLILG